jgi:hypothetical protein
MEKNFKASKPAEPREMHKDIREVQKDTKKQVTKTSAEQAKNDVRKLDFIKEMKPVSDSKTTSKIKKFFEQKSGKIQ